MHLLLGECQDKPNMPQTSPTGYAQKTSQQANNALYSDRSPTTDYQPVKLTECIDMIYMQTD